MRIIAGDFGGRRLHAPRGLSTRPTADRVKEALFNILGPPVRREGARFRVLDLYAGSGALGLEAISRGADEAVLVDEDRLAVQAAEENVAALGVGAKVRIVSREVGKALTSLDGIFDWVFLDPPYQGGSLDRALRLLGTRNLVAGIAIAEHDVKNPPDERYGRIALSDRRSWGSIAVSFYRPDEPPKPIAEAPVQTPAETLGTDGTRHTGAPKP